MTAMSGPYFGYYEGIRFVESLNLKEDNSMATGDLIASQTASSTNLGSISSGDMLTFDGTGTVWVSPVYQSQALQVSPVNPYGQQQQQIAYEKRQRAEDLERFLQRQREAQIQEREHKERKIDMNRLKDMDLGNLMELVDDCDKAQTIKGVKKAAKDRVDQLKKGGFKEAAAKLQEKIDHKKRQYKLAFYQYVTIVPDKIKAYLDRKAKEYNKKYAKTRGPRESFRSGSIPVSPHYRFISKTADYDLHDPDTIGQFLWIETPVKDYKGIPPENVVDLASEHANRNIFDELVVAEVKGIAYPLLLGYIKGDENRYFIAQWGDDVQLDDLL